MESLGLAATIALKFLGAVSGAILALVFLPPTTRGEFIRRFSLSLASGIIFGDPAKDYLRWPDTWQMYLASSAGVAMLSWFVMGAIVRLIGAWKPKE